MKNSNFKSGRPSASFIAGSVALVFLIIGYQTAIFIHKASAMRLLANHDHPDTVFVQGPPPAGETVDSSFPDPADGACPAGKVHRPSEKTVRKEYAHSEEAVMARREVSPRRYESFRFDPNTATVDDLMRLGFSLKQAQSIDSYRQKGGRFRRPSDFAKSYVVEDSVFQRLEPYIDIPLLDINTADSAAFETLPGIGGFFASRMVSYREDLGGYSYPEQLMDIWHFDQKKFDGLKDLVVVGPEGRKEFALWTLGEKELSRHPYIDSHAAHAIVIFRDNTPREQWDVEALVSAGILDGESGSKLSRCVIAEPR